MKESLSFPWNTFSELQRATDTSVISHPSDEALTALLDDLASGDVPRDDEAMMRRYRSLVTNRAKKYRSRLKIAPLVEYHERQRHERRDAFEQTADREVATLALCRIEREDRRLLADVFIAGCSYEEAAKIRRRPVGTMKARVSRLRKQIRVNATRSIMRREIPYSSRRADS